MLVTALSQIIDTHPVPLSREMSTDIVLHIVCNSTLAVDSVASLTIPI